MEVTQSLRKRPRSSCLSQVHDLPISGNVISPRAVPCAVLFYYQSLLLRAVLFLQHLPRQACLHSVWGVHRNLVLRAHSFEQYYITFACKLHKFDFPEQGQEKDGRL